MTNRDFRSIRHLPWALLAIGLGLVAPLGRAAEWRVAETDNFRVCCLPPHDPTEVAAACERLRERLSQHWLGEAEPVWRPICHVVLHASPASYLRAVGRGGESTLGSATVSYDESGVSFRRLDLRGDIAEPLVEALPHELTHVVLADRFVEIELPRWADEGAAVHADRPGKQAAHRRDLHTALARTDRGRLSELLTQDDRAFGGRRDAFYGHSAALVEFLVARGGPHEFLRFVATAQRDGYGPALQSHYGFAGTGQLEAEWRDFVRQAPAPRSLAAFDAPALSNGAL